MPPIYMNGVPELLLLRLLSDRESYGYELSGALRVATSERLALGEGSIYTTLHALEAKGLVRTRTVLHEGRPRVYYRVTAKGSKRLAAATDTWRRVSRSVNAVLAKGLHGVAL